MLLQQDESDVIHHIEDPIKFDYSAIIVDTHITFDLMAEAFLNLISCSMLSDESQNDD